MTYEANHLAKTIFLTTCLTLGCTSSGTLGCGSDGAAAPTLDTQLLGIYTLDKYQHSPDGCDQLMDVDPAPSRLVIYTVPSSENPDRAILVGQFCVSEPDCRSKANGPSTPVSYSFLQGSDSAGWQGWGIASRGSAGDQCLVEVQTHTLTSPGAQAIRIDTTQVETEFKPSDPAPGSNEVTCSIKDAIDSVDADSPCKALFLLEATFEKGL